MNRKDFLKRGILGSAIFTSASSMAKMAENEIDELKKLEIIGFNHIKNTNSKIMANTVLHKSESRGKADHGWLKSHHSFSFANYYNPERMHFGVLRVLNDDSVASGMGFGTHPHDNMEIISIPLEGDLEHKDSMGNVTVIREGDIQIMSAGTGITHSEYNKNKDRDVKFLQIWLFPNQKNVTPRYDQITLGKSDNRNQLQQILSPNPKDEGVWIHQNAWFHLGKFDNGVNTRYALKEKSNGVYVFVIKGDWKINDQMVNSRDGYGVWNVDGIDILSLSDDAEILIMEVPMSL